MKHFFDMNLDIKHNDIFWKDYKENTIYRFLGKRFFVNDTNIQQKILRLEKLKPYIISYKAPVLIPLIFISILIELLCHLLIDNFNLPSDQFIITITGLLYIIVIVLLYLRIFLMIKNSPAMYDG
jgi:hypothetical protein